MDKEACFEQFRRKLTNLRINSTNTPYKAILMISIIDMFDHCISNLFLKTDAKLKLLYHNNWEKYVEKDILLQEDLCKAIDLMNNEDFCRNCRSRKSSGGQIKGIALNEQLRDFLLEKNYRIKLRSAIVSKYFPQNSYKVSFDKIDAKNDTTLRDYQIEAKNKVYEFLKDHKSVMLQMPTGTGKTRVFVSIVRDLHNWGAENKTAVKVLVLAHRRELIEQIDTELSVKYHLAHGIIMSQNLENKKIPVQVGCVPTLNRRMNNWADKDFDFVIVDEAHHVKADSYKKIISEYPNAKLLGLTATPYRLNGTGFKEDFEGLILAEPIKWFIDHKFLCDYVYYSIKPQSKLQEDIDKITKFALDGDYAEDAMIEVMDKDYVRANIVETYQKYAEGKKGIVYCINKEHNKHVCDRFKQIGVKAAAIDSSTPKEERENLVEQFRLGKLQVLCNVNIFSEGFDCPDVEFIQLARPTKSLSMYLQQVGRGLRTADGKDRAIFLDNVGLYNKFGFPSARRRWQQHFEGREVDETERYEGNECEHEVKFFDEEEGNEEVHQLYSTENNELKYDTGSKNYEKEFVDFCFSQGLGCGKSYVSTIRNHTDVFIRDHVDSTFSSVLNMIDVNELHRLKDELFGMTDFVDLDAKKNRYLSASLKKYIAFAEQYNFPKEEPKPIDINPESGLNRPAELEIERVKLLRDIEALNRWGYDIPSRLQNDLDAIEWKLDTENRLKETIQNVMNETNFFGDLVLTIGKDGSCLIDNSSDFYNEKEYEQYKVDEKSCLKWYGKLSPDLERIIKQMESFLAFEEKMKETIQEIAVEDLLTNNYKVIVTRKRWICKVI